MWRFKPVLNAHMEFVLTEHCRNFDPRFCGLTRKRFIQLAFDFDGMDFVTDLKLKHD
jgi:hypothetical protein